MAILTLKTERHAKAVAHHAVSELNVASVLNAQNDQSVVSAANAAIVTALKLLQVLPQLVWSQRLLLIKQTLITRLSIKMTTKALPKKAPQKANATNAAAATVMAVNVASAMVIALNELNVLQSKTLK